MKNKKVKAGKQDYLERIDQFYRRSLPSNREIIVLQYTPKYLIQLGAKQLPIVIKQSTLNKCIRHPKGSRSAHNLSRDIIEGIPGEVKNPIIIVKDEGRNTLVLICQGIDQDGNNLLIALQLNNILYGNEINEIKSIYGKKHLLEYLKKQNVMNIYIIDKEKVNTLSPSIGFQLPKPPTDIDYENNISLHSDSVKPK